MRKSNEHKSYAGKKKLVTSSFLFYLAAAALTLCFFAGSATAQSGYVVQPGIINLTVNPRDLYTGELKLHNFDPNNEIKVDIKVLELTQADNGEWLPYDTDPCSSFDYYPYLNLSTVSSCRSWIKLETQNVTVPADGDAVVGVKINTPYGAKKGFYGAAIMCSTKTKASVSEKVPMVIRTGVPVIANVQPGGAVLATNVEIKDLGMEFVPSDGPVPGKVFLTMTVNNTGISFPRLRPIIRIRGFINGHWQLITTHEFSDVGIIPGKELTLRSYIGKSLPSAKYELESVLYTNGQLKGKNSRLEKNIEFEGDPMITKVASDVPLDVNPMELVIITKPGQKQLATLKVYTAVTDKIQIQPILDIPKHIKEKATTKGALADTLTCTKWLTIEPETFSLQDYQGKSVSIIAQMPEDALEYPNYYATIGIKTTYMDGQSAGTKWINVCVQNENATPEPQVVCSSLNLEESNASKSQYLVDAIFTNSGTTHIVPQRLRVAVAKADGLGHTSSTLSSAKYGMLMPYESRTFQGILDFSNVEPDTYNLEVLMDYPSGKVTKQIRVKVSVVRDRRVVEVVNRNVNKDELVEVQWY